MERFPGEEAKVGERGGRFPGRGMKFRRDGERVGGIFSKISL